MGARDLIRLVKLWAHNHGLAHQDEGYMNGMAWSLLCLVYLQKEKYIVPWTALKYGGVPSGGTPQLCVLLRGFFEFLSTIHGSAPRKCSVTRGQVCPAPAGIPLFIEDPSKYQQFT